MNLPLSQAQLKKLESALHQGAAEASAALATWLAVPSVIELDAIEQRPLSEVAELLGNSDETNCFCSMEINGSLGGQIILACDDQSGLALTDLLLGHQTGMTTEWDEVAQSAALETVNILGCAYLNSLSTELAREDSSTLELIPTPPVFRRDFAESLLQAAFLGQAMTSDFAVAAKANFRIRGEHVDWNLLFVPDAKSMQVLQELSSS